MKREKVYPLKLSLKEYEKIKNVAEISGSTMAEIIRTGAVIWSDARAAAIDNINDRALTEEERKNKFNLR